VLGIDEASEIIAEGIVDLYRIKRKEWLNYLQGKYNIEATDSSYI
jgi:hypothetical protein